MACCTGGRAITGIAGRARSAFNVWRIAALPGETAIDNASRCTVSSSADSPASSLIGNRHFSTYLVRLANEAANVQLARPSHSGAGGARIVSHFSSHAGEASAILRGALKDQEVVVTNFSREEKGTALVAGDIFDVPIRRDIVHRVVVWQLAKRRQGTHSTKTISEVSGTGRKPGPQKGTGRARHGSLRGPQFRGGATMHGPKPRDYEYTLQKKVRRMGLKVALSARLAEGKLKVFENIEPPSARTKDMVKAISEIEDCKKVLFVEESEKVNDTLCRATNNLFYANVIPVKGLNVYSILQHDTLVMTLGAIRSLEQRLHTPISR